MKNSLITIGESIHASIPKTSAIMKQLAQLGSEAYSKQTEQLNFIKYLVELKGEYWVRKRMDYWLKQSYRLQGREKNNLKILNQEYQKLFR